MSETGRRGKAMSEAEIRELAIKVAVSKTSTDTEKAEILAALGRMAGVTR